MIRGLDRSVLLAVGHVYSARHRYHYRSASVNFSGIQDSSRQVKPAARSLFFCSFSIEWGSFTRHVSCFYKHCWRAISPQVGTIWSGAIKLLPSRLNGWQNSLSCYSRTVFHISQAPDRSWYINSAGSVCEGIAVLPFMTGSPTRPRCCSLRGEIGLCC